MNVMCAYAQSGAISQQRLMSVVDRYKPEPEFTLVNIGSMGTSLVKSMVKRALKEDNDEDARQIAKLISGIRKISIVEFDGCSDALKGRVNADLQNLFSGAEMLMEVKSGEDVLKMYGVVGKDGDKVRDFILYAPGNSALICLFGTMSMEALGALAAQ